jgi:biopolymer transport protein ExbB/TolQ
VNDGKLLEWLVASCLGLISVIFGIFTVAHRKQGDRIDEMEKCMVTAEEFKSAFNALRDDRRDMHRENRDAMSEFKRQSESHLARIETKIDQNEERSSNTRHEIRNYVQEMAGGLLVVKTELKQVQAAVVKIDEQINDLKQ